MRIQSGKIVLILLIPVVLYGAAKGLLYYKAKQAVDDIVVAASNHADIRYADISTELGGVVTVKRITVQPRGYEDSIGIDAVRISSDDPMFFIHGAQWRPGENAPPPRLGFDVSGISLPLDADLLRDAQMFGAASDDANPCAEGLKIDPAMLRQLGFADLKIDFGGFYRLDEAARELEVGIDLELRDIESVQLNATLADVDVEAVKVGAPPQVSLGSLGMTLRVEPAFGRQLLKRCAVGSEQPIEAWSEHLADVAVAKLEGQGLTLGGGLTRAMRQFYTDWGEITVEARPSTPLGLLSLMFLPPDQLAPALGIRMRLNEQPIADTSFTWQQPDGSRLSALFGQEQQGGAGATTPVRPNRILVRRAYERVAIGDIGGFVDHRVRVKPRGQPLREGVLKGIVNGEAEVVQTLHGGKFTVYVPLAQIESLQALVERPIEAAN